LQINIKSSQDFAIPMPLSLPLCLILHRERERERERDREREREFILYEKSRTLIGFACSWEQSGLEKEPTSWSSFHVELQIEETGEEVVGMCSAGIFVFAHLSTFLPMPWIFFTPNGFFFFFFLMHSFTAETTLSFTYFTKSFIVFFKNHVLKLLFFSNRKF